MGMNKEKAAEEPTRKEYRAPRLVTYGDLRTLTRAPKGGTKGDGGDGRPTFNTRA